MYIYIYIYNHIAGPARRLPGWSGLATTTLASPMLAYARLEAITSTAPPLSGEARTLLAAQCFPSAGVPAAPVAAVCSALGVPAERTAAPAPEARLPLRLLRPEPTEQERTLWKECSVLGLHEIFSMEFLDALSSAVSELLPPPAPVAAGGSSSDQLPVVLEIGAGSGSLSHQLGQRLLQAVRQVRLPLAQGELSFSVSIGAALLAGPGDDLEAMMHRADAALYAAKAGGRDRLAWEGWQPPAP